MHCATTIFETVPENDGQQISRISRMDIGKMTFATRFKCKCMTLGGADAHMPRAKHSQKLQRNGHLHRSTPNSGKTSSQDFKRRPFPSCCRVSCYHDRLTCPRLPRTAARGRAAGMDPSAIRSRQWTRTSSGYGLSSCSRRAADGHQLATVAAHAAV